MSFKKIVLSVCVILSFVVAQDMQKDSVKQNAQDSRDLQVSQNTITLPKTPITSPTHISANAEHIAYNGTAYIFTTSKSNPKPLNFSGKKIAWLAHPAKENEKIAIVPIPYRTNLGRFELQKGLFLEVKGANYKKEKITITDTSKVRPNKAQQKRVADELNEANAIYRNFADERQWSEPFALPMQSVITSHYGNARVFNGEVRSYHAGTDFRAAIGTPIRAINDGIVALSKERFMSGNSVIISHGEGIYSAYFHCSELKVAVGERVKKGQIIALSGDTGRVSGAHLHFSMMVQGVSVDSLHFISTINALFE